MDINSKIGEIHVLLAFQAHASVTGMHLLVKKGLITVDEYNDHIKKAEENLIKHFESVDGDGFDFEAAIRDAFDRFYIPETADPNIPWGKFN